MKIFISVLFLVYGVFSFSTTFAQIRISSDFEHGSIGSLKEIKENVFTGQTMHWIKKDKIGNQYYWFYFKISDVKGKTLSFELRNMTGTYRNYPHEIFRNWVQPVLSYDNKNWNRINTVSYDDQLKTFSFKVSFDKDTAWIAYAHPYTLSFADTFTDLIKNNTNVQIESIGKSVEGRDIRMITITNPVKSIKYKKVVMITALQHSGEDCGGYLMEGVIKELLADKQEMQVMRDKFIFKLIPVMNPDGLFHGTSRYNWNMEDLNSKWNDDISDTVNISLVPEVVVVKKWAKEWFCGGNRIDIFFDVHSNSQQSKWNAFHNTDNTLKQFCDSLNNNWNIKYMPNGFKGSAADYFTNHYKVPSGTIELTQSFVEKKSNVYLTINDYFDYGKILVQSVGKYVRQD
ncbi:MAG: M14-type cytosolic carboxypeptidase [Ignavibacteria bacterium]|nr:M14-type cytosolic carboxypeptidase [Ignavibacteria bacterium]